MSAYLKTERNCLCCSFHAAGKAFSTETHATNASRQAKQTLIKIIFLNEMHLCNIMQKKTKINKT